MINRADEAFLIGGWCLSSLWGIFTALVFYCVRQVVERKKTYLSRSIFLTTIAVVVLWALNTVYTGLACASLVQGLIFTEGTDERIAYFANNGSAASDAGLAIFIFIFIISDSILVWRLHVMWGRKKWLTSGATMFLVAEAVSGIVGFVSYSPAIFDNALATHANTVFLVVSLIVNAVVPVLTAGRIWWLSREVECASRIRIPSTSSRYRIIIHLILDSGLILTAAKIFELAFWLLSSEPDMTGRTNESFRIVQEMLVVVAGMVPTIIIIIVNTSNSAAMREPMSVDIESRALGLPAPAEVAARHKNETQISSIVFERGQPDMMTRTDNRSPISVSFQGGGLSRFGQSVDDVV